MMVVGAVATLTLQSALMRRRSDGGYVNSPQAAYAA